MIAALLVYAAGRHVLETVSPSATNIRLVAIVSLPPLGPHGTRIARSIVASMKGDTDDFTRRQVLDIVSTGPRFEWTPDHIRVEFTVGPKSLRTGLRLMESLVRRPSIENLLTAPEGSPWSRAAYQIQPDLRPMGPAEVDAIRSIILRLDRITVAVSGPIVPGEPTQYWQEISQENPDPKPIKFYEPAPPPVNLPSVVNSLAGPAISANDPDLPATILAMIALGSGKASTLHRVLREDLGLSYRQEAVLTPVPQGWIPQLIFQLGPGSGGDSLSVAKAAIANDVSSWTEANRLRALGMAKVIFRLGVPFSPLYNEPSGPSGSGEETFFDAWWFSRTGQRFDVAAFLDRLGSVDLEKLKKTAAQIVSGPPSP
jgi:hypothetical protein